MLKYKDVMVTFEEVPSEVTLCINITGCPIHCPDCHSKHLWENVGENLTVAKLSQLISENEGITCVSFMGGDNSPEEIYVLAKAVKTNTNLKVCWYSGTDLKEEFHFHMEYFDYVKTGPYKKELGGLDSPTTNQRFFCVLSKDVKNMKGNIISRYWYLKDITNKFWKDEGSSKYS